MIPWLNAPTDFPPADAALPDPPGLLAAGGSLAPQWLLAAYSRGIFPWFSEQDPILWWSPDPRMILVPGEQRLTRSLAKTLRKQGYTVRCDSAFTAVVAACAEPREAGGGTWIVPQMQAAYAHLHALGWAHSVEVWQDGELTGGLYGVALGGIFFGESMFHRRTDASKIAFMHLAALLERENFLVLDCQMTTSHLLSLGCREIARHEFVTRLPQWIGPQASPAPWPEDFACCTWEA